MGYSANTANSNLSSAIAPPDKREPRRRQPCIIAVHERECVRHGNWTLSHFSPRHWQRTLSDLCGFANTAVKDSKMNRGVDGSVGWKAEPRCATICRALRILNQFGHCSCPTALVFTQSPAVLLSAPVRNGPGLPVRSIAVGGKRGLACNNTLITNQQQKYF